MQTHHVYASTWSFDQHFHGMLNAPAATPSRPPKITTIGGSILAVSASVKPSIPIATDVLGNSDESLHIVQELSGT
jgi:hypothetical protein